MAVATTPRNTNPLDAAPADAASDARVLVEARPLPTDIQLLAPFRRAPKARGFVAMTGTGMGSHEDAGARQGPRTVVPIHGGDVTRPVLVASFTKLWTAIAALRMLERKELSLDETIKDVLPELASRPWADSTLRELLSHTSRVPEFEEANTYYRREVDFSTPVDVLSKHVPRTWAEKRGVYKYRNAEFAIVGAMLAAHAKQPASRVLAREVFEPAGMKTAGLLLAASKDVDLAPMGSVRAQNFFTAGAGYASPDDLLSFFEALAGDRLLSSASKDLLFDASAERGQSALGCWAYPFPRPDGGTVRLVERPGSFGNVHLVTAWFPEEERAVVAWTSDGEDIGRPRIAKSIAASLAAIALQ